MFPFLVGYIPLCENMPGGAATKPGDVVTASNGKTIQVTAASKDVEETIKQSPMLVAI